MTKPRIKLIEIGLPLFSRRWICAGDGWKGWGLTPEHAYVMWCLASGRLPMVRRRRHN